MSGVFAGIAIAVGGAIAYDASKDAEKAQKRQIEAQRKQAEIQNLRSVRSSVRERYRATAGVISAGALGGVSASSGVAGGVSSLGAQLAGNLSYMSDMAGAKEEEFSAAMDYASAQGKAALGQAFQSIGSAGFSYGGHFKKKPTP